MCCISNSKKLLFVEPNQITDDCDGEIVMANRLADRAANHQKWINCQAQRKPVRAYKTCVANLNCSSSILTRLPPQKSYGVAINASRWWLEKVSGRVCLRDKRRGNRVVARWQGKMGLAAGNLVARLVRRLNLRALCGNVTSIRNQLTGLGIDLDYGVVRDLPKICEPSRLISAGIDRFRRTIWLEPDTQNAWLAMQAAAIKAGVQVEIISAFRSQHYQADLVRRKVKRGQAIAEILKVSAAPGFSEHHSGRAIDLAEPGMPALVEAFADSAAFSWLQANAPRFGFIMSFPPENRHGVMYEPWHWCYQPRNTRRSNNIECEV